MKDRGIDAGKAFDWGRISEDYARYRDIYPQTFYDRILVTNLVAVQNIARPVSGAGERRENKLPVQNIARLPPTVG